MIHGSYQNHFCVLSRRTEVAEIKIKNLVSVCFLVSEIMALPLETELVLPLCVAVEGDGRTFIV